MSAPAATQAGAPLPCPFCGGPLKASCLGNCAIGPGPSGAVGDEASAVEVWNCRATATAMTKAEAEALVGTFWRAIVEDEYECRRGLPVDGLRPPHDYQASYRAAAAIVAALTGGAS